MSLELNRGEIPTVNVRWFPPAQLQGPSLGENTTSRLSQNLFDFNFVSIFSRVNNHSKICQFSLAEILNVIFVIIEYVFFLQINVLGYNVFYKKENKESWVVKFADRSTFLVLKNLSFDTTYYVRVNVRYEDDVRAKLSRTSVIKTFSLGWCAILTKFTL